jgi:hypothetical protein
MTLGEIYDSNQPLPLLKVQRILPADLAFSHMYQIAHRRLSFWEREDLLRFKEDEFLQAIYPVEGIPQEVIDK